MHYNYKLATVLYVNLVYSPLPAAWYREPGKTYYTSDIVDGTNLTWFHLNQLQPIMSLGL